ncbi:glycosyl hydrolase family 43 (plasmid) [Vibrio sp. qd031]|nr:glycosyl hydrolase family 43 [Vibrio sp. qd031]
MSEKTVKRPQNVSELCGSLSVVGRILEDPDYNVWGCSPIYGPDGKVHVFYSRWVNEANHEGWLSCCEIAHAVADDPAGPYETVDVAITGRGGDWWDAMTCHNPTIHKVGDKYVLFYMGTQDGTVYTKRIGMATSDTLNGPWERTDEPIIMPNPEPAAWDSMCTTNPAFLHHPNGELWMYYKSWCINDWEHDIEINDWRTTNRQYGLAIAKDLNGPWVKQSDDALLDLRQKVQGAQSEDAYIWFEDGTFKMIMRDMGFWNHEYGLYFESQDGKNWGDPQIGFWDAFRYFTDEQATGAWGEGRFERPQLLIKDGIPEYIFVAYRGGEFGTSSGAVLKVNK